MSLSNAKNAIAQNLQTYLQTILKAMYAKKQESVRAAILLVAIGLMAIGVLDMCGLNKPKPLSAYTIDDLLYHLKKQFPDHDATCNTCATEGCGKTVVGTGFCKDCLMTALLTMASPKNVSGFVVALERKQAASNLVYQFECEMREAAK